MSFLRNSAIPSLRNFAAGFFLCRQSARWRAFFSVYFSGSWLPRPCLCRCLFTINPIRWVWRTSLI